MCIRDRQYPKHSLAQGGIGVQTGQTHAVQGCIAPVFPAGGGVYMADDSRFRVNVIDAPVRVDVYKRQE